MKTPWWKSWQRARQLSWGIFHPHHETAHQKFWIGVRIALLVIFIFLVAVLWPLRSLFFKGFFTGRTLIIFTNEAEARPCGGFVSAFGVVEFFPPRLEFKNSYALEAFDFGPAEPPLDQVAQTQKFWDLGTSADLDLCAENFRLNFERATKEDVNQAVLINGGTIEKLFRFFDPVELEGRTLTTKNFFSELTKMASDVDRHDEKALQERKTPLALLGKKMMWRVVRNPFLLPRIVQTVEKEIHNGQIYIPKISPVVSPERTDFALLEWNLGGAKSSRFLKKILHITAREVEPQKWGFVVELQVDHLGGVDEPLSQDWKGVFELRMPKFLNQEPIQIPAEIAPGAPFRKNFIFQYEGKLNEFSLFRQRGQELFADVAISLFPQKTFEQATFPTHENVGTFFGEIKSVRKWLRWEEIPDTSLPFVTLHEIVSAASVRASNATRHLSSEFLNAPILVEVHLNEVVRLTDDFLASLFDTNFENKEVTENPLLFHVALLNDQKTLLLGFGQEEAQPLERFSFVMKGVEDLWGNTLRPVPRTVIDRQP